MANCTRCGKDVGCGCNLKNGLCATCNQPKTTTKPTIEPPKIQDLIDVAKDANKN